MRNTQDRLNSKTYVLDSHLLWGAGEDRHRETEVMTQEHILEYRYYTWPEFAGEGYWSLSHPGGCSLMSCPMNKALDDLPEKQGRYRVSVGSLCLTKVGAA